MIISISGRIGAGRDTVGKIIQILTRKPDRENQNTSSWKTEEIIKMMPNPDWDDVFDWEIKKFAGKLKDIVCLLTGCTRQDLESQEFKDKEIGREWWSYRAGSWKNLLAPKPYLLTTPNFATDKIVEELGHERIKKPTYRLLLQELGTEALRNVIHENVWVNSLFSDYKDEWDGMNTYNNTDKLPKWIITDTRFPNELKAVKDRGGLTINIVKRMDWKNPDGSYTKYHVGSMLDKRVNGERHASETALSNCDFDEVIYNEGDIEDLISEVRKILIKHKILKDELTS